MSNLSKEYVTSLLPNNLRDTWTFSRVVELLLATFSEEVVLENGTTTSTSTGKQINSLYNDLVYYPTDFSKLSYQMKKSKIKDMGFSYIFDYLDTTEEALNSLGTLINLLKFYKGRQEGLELLLNSFNLTYTYSSWCDPDYEGETFTVTLKINVTAEEYTEGSLASKIKELARHYLLPEVVVLLVTTEDIAVPEIDASWANNYFSTGLLKDKKYATFEIIQSL